jgi:Txe/YoeB family toxin of Txe-Axe toxin-antitoxin module
MSIRVAELKDRIVFRIKDGAIEILQVGTHYGDQ